MHFPIVFLTPGLNKVFLIPIRGRSVKNIIIHQNYLQRIESLPQIKIFYFLLSLQPWIFQISLWQKLNSLVQNLGNVEKCSSS